VKKLKLVQLLGIALLLLGVILRIATGESLWIGVAVCGLLVYAFSRIAFWLRSDTP
jgi:hypothetical protein